MSVYPTGTIVARGADLSIDGRYRYVLSRRWGRGLLLPFVMLNPSTADADLDDPTIRKCVGFAQRLTYHGVGFDGIEVVNLYAYRATDPRDLWAAQEAGTDIVGPSNDWTLAALFEDAAELCTPVVAAWGAHAKAERVREVLDMPFARHAMHRLALTSKGIPRHPLMLGYDGAALAPLADTAS